MAEWISPTAKFNNFSIIEDRQDNLFSQDDLKFLVFAYPHVLAFSQYRHGRPGSCSDASADQCSAARLCNSTKPAPTIVPPITLRTLPVRGDRDSSLFTSAPSMVRVESLDNRGFSKHYIEAFRR